MLSKRAIKWFETCSEKDIVTAIFKKNMEADTASYKWKNYKNVYLKSITKIARLLLLIIFLLTLLCHFKWSKYTLQQ